MIKWSRRLDSYLYPLTSTRQDAYEFKSNGSLEFSTDTLFQIKFVIISRTSLWAQFEVKNGWAGYPIFSLGSVGENHKTHWFGNGTCDCSTGIKGGDRIGIGCSSKMYTWCNMMISISLSLYWVTHFSLIIIMILEGMLLRGRSACPIERKVYSMAYVHCMLI